MAEDVKGFLLQSAHRFQLNVEPGTGEGTYARVAAGLTTFDPQWNDEIDQTAYLDGDGHLSSDVTGKQLVISFEGHRKFGDVAQDYIASLQGALGEDVKSDFRWTDPSGTTIEGDVTIANVVVSGGAANEKSTFSFEIHFNGKPTIAETPPTP